MTLLKDWSRGVSKREGITITAAYTRMARGTVLGLRLHRFGRESVVLKPGELAVDFWPSKAFMVVVRVPAPPRFKKLTMPTPCAKSCLCGNIATIKKGDGFGWVCARCNGIEQRLEADFIQSHKPRLRA